ncbi:MAG: chloride channel protein, partial [Bacteroidetes bacterium]|nr:chloride channel protein [Bacteroidota bacterium]
TNFATVLPNQTLGDLVKIIASSSRNIFPVVDENGIFKGHILFDDVRKFMFDTTLYNTPVEKIMVYPDYVINYDETMESIVQKFEESHKYNIVIVDNGNYLGYISRANVFTAYQATLKEISAE